MYLILDSQASQCLQPVDQLQISITYLSLKRL
jgi:hypothetical protein